MGSGFSVGARCSCPAGGRVHGSRFKCHCGSSLWQSQESQNGVLLTLLYATRKDRKGQNRQYIMPIVSAPSNMVGNIFGITMGDSRGIGWDHMPGKQ